MLRADRLPDRLPQGELHGRLHGLGAVGLPGQRGEGRRGGRRVPAPGHRGPPAVRRCEARSSSRSRTRRSGSGCSRSRTSARARSSRSSRRARPRGRSSRSATSAGGSTCGSANRKVLESLAKVGALNAFGHPAQVLEGLDDAIAAGAATQRDLATGQTSLFDVGAADSMVMERPLPNVARGARPRAAPLGEGAARPVPVRAPDGRGRRPGRGVRDGVLGRPPIGRDARRPAAGRRRDRRRRRGRSSRGRARRCPW